MQERPVVLATVEGTGLPDNCFWSANVTTCRGICIGKLAALGSRIASGRSAFTFGGIRDDLSGHGLSVEGE